MNPIRLSTMGTLLLRVVSIALRRDVIAHRPLCTVPRPAKRGGAAEQLAQTDMSGCGRAAGAEKKMIDRGRLNGRQ
jgi:hypothetical protein